MNPSDEDPDTIIMPREKGRITKLIAKMGLGAFTLSIAVHLIFGVLAFSFFYELVYPVESKVEFLPGGGSGGPKNDGTQAQRIITKRVMTSSTMNKRIASTSSSASFSLPEASEDMIGSELPMELGSLGSGNINKSAVRGMIPGTIAAQGAEFKAGQQGLGALIPTIMKGRCTDAERLRMLRDAGGTPEIEAAIQKSLQWMKSKQNADGSWASVRQVGMTGLTLLCYLGHCEGSQSEEYGATVSAGMTYLINSAAKNQGRMTSNLSEKAWPYEHGIATYALAEALTFSRSLQFPFPELEETVRKAALIIIEGQTRAGSWDYNYKLGDRDDLSIAGWQMQALKAVDAAFPRKEDKPKDLDRAMRSALDHLAGVAYLGGGKFAYSFGGTNPNMTAVGALCLQQWDKGNTKPVRDSVRLIMEGLELRGKPLRNPNETDFRPIWSFEYNGPNADLYGWYYAVQVMRNAGGKEWEATNQAIIEDILPAQNSDGSFKFEGGGGKLVHLESTKAAGEARDIYLQTLNTLILQVYYRFLPTSAGKDRSPGYDALR